MKSTARKHDIPRPGTVHSLRTCAKFDIKQIHRFVFPWRRGLSTIRTRVAELDYVDTVLRDGIQGTGQQDCVLRAGQQPGKIEYTMEIPRWQIELSRQPLP